MERFAQFKVPIILGSISIIAIVISLTLLVKSIQTAAPIEFSHSADEASVSGQAAKHIIVDIEGAVAKPGVYELPSDSRIEQALVRAGGLTDEADREKIAKTINLAQVLIDGAKLYFPKSNDSPDSNIVRRKNSSLVSINAASQSELESLPGVGPATAGKIISNRPYQTLTELVTKKAMSQSLFDKLKDSLGL